MLTATSSKQTTTTLKQGKDCPLCAAMKPSKERQ